MNKEEKLKDLFEQQRIARLRLDEVKDYSEFVGFRWIKHMQIGFSLHANDKGDIPIFVHLHNRELPKEVQSDEQHIILNMLGELSKIRQDTLDKINSEITLLLSNK